MLCRMLMCDVGSWLWGGSYFLVGRQRKGGFCFVWKNDRAWILWFILQIRFWCLQRCKFHGTVPPEHKVNLEISRNPLGPRWGTHHFPQAAKLLEPMPHSLLLQTSNQQYFALLPNIKVRLFPTKTTGDENKFSRKKHRLTHQILFML